MRKDDDETYLDRDDLVLLKQPLRADPLHQVEQACLALLHERRLEGRANRVPYSWILRRAFLA